MPNKMEEQLDLFTPDKAKTEQSETEGQGINKLPTKNIRRGFSHKVLNGDYSRDENYEPEDRKTDQTGSAGKPHSRHNRPVYPLGHHGNIEDKIN